MSTTLIFVRCGNDSTIFLAGLYDDTDGNQGRAAFDDTEPCTRVGGFLPVILTS